MNIKKILQFTLILIILIEVTLFVFHMISNNVQNTNYNIEDATPTDSVELIDTNSTSSNEAIASDLPEVPTVNSTSQNKVSIEAEENVEITHEEEVAVDPKPVTSTPVNPSPEVTEITTDDEIKISKKEGELSLEDLVEEIHRFTNIERQKAGQTKLQHNSEIAAVATGHSEDMAKRDYFSHKSPEGCDFICRLKGTSYDKGYRAENIAYIERSKLPDASSLAKTFVNNWMNSPGHRKNILSSKYNQEGVGVSLIGNRVYATVVFVN